MAELSKEKKTFAVIFTALQVEHDAVCSHLKNVKQVEHPKGSIYERGSFSSGDQTIEIGIAEIGEGNEQTALEVERAIEYFKPSIILFVGVAGGIKKGVKHGDVVVASKVYLYESGKADETFKARPQTLSPNYKTFNKVKVLARSNDWIKYFNEKLPNPLPNVFVKPIASGSKVVNSTLSETYKLIKKVYEDSLAVEMEGYGFFKAANANTQVDAIAIRGISDLIDDKEIADEKGFQEIASFHASVFAFYILANLFNEPLDEKDEEKKVHNARRDFMEFKSDDDESEQYLNILDEIETISKEDFYLNSKYRYGKHICNHCHKVEENIYKLIPHDDKSKESILTCRERFLLISSVWLHDIGMMPNLFIGRDNNEKYADNITVSGPVVKILTDILNYTNNKDKPHVNMNVNLLFSKLFPEKYYKDYTDSKKLEEAKPSYLNKIRRKHSQRSCIYILNSCKIKKLKNYYKNKEKIKENFEDDINKIAEICLLHPRNAYPILNKLNNDNCVNYQNTSNSDTKFIRLPLLISFLRLADILHVPKNEETIDFAEFLAQGPDQKAKFHWCKSKFVKEIDIQIKNKLIIISTKRPIKIPLEEIDNWIKKIEPMQTFIKEEIQWELDSVRDIICRCGISYCLRIDHKKSFLDENLNDADIQEYEQVLKYIDLVNNPSETPSSSLIVGSIVKMLKIILNSENNEENNEERLSHLGDFKKNVLDKEMKQRSKQALLFEIESKIDTILGYKDEPDSETVTNLLTNFTSFINNWDVQRTQVVQKIAIHTMSIFEKNNSILLYGYSDTILKCFDYLLNKDDEVKLKLYICEVRPKTAYGYNNKLLYSDGIKNIRAFEKFNQEDNSKSKTRRIEINFLPDIAVSHLFETKKKEGIELKVILGTNTINHQGNISHTLGVKMIADAAKEYDIPVYIIAESAKCIDRELKPLKDNFREGWFTTDITNEPVLNNCLNFNPREDIITIDKINYYITENGIVNAKEMYEIVDGTLNVDSINLISFLTRSTNP
jgi:nucleoside phosphorylase/translation initiation factor 2B subunit (eIF-2B alpha/beta/delta family)